MNDLCGDIKDMKNNKAAGLDDILCEQIKHLGSVALQWLLDMFNECMRTNSIPKISGLCSNALAFASANAAFAFALALDSLAADAFALSFAFDSPAFALAFDSNAFD